jgi:polyvinyl alcohol dehydrogenase (cytochrome)
MRAILLVASLGMAWGQEGAVVYGRHCSTCHEAKVAARVPGRKELEKLPAERIVRSLTSGMMRQQGEGLSRQQRFAVAEYLTGRKVVEGEVETRPRCAARSFEMSGPTWNGWGVDARNTRYQPEPGLSAADVPRLRLRWAFAFPGDTQAFGQPTVMGGRVFAGSQGGRVYSLDARTGCVYWEFDAGAAVRTAIEISAQKVAFFGDLAGFLYALEAETGRLLWKTRVDAHPHALITGAVKVAGDKVIVPVSSFEEGPAADGKYECCTFRGSVAAVAAATGKEVWRAWMIDKPASRRGKNKLGTPRYGPSGVAVWSSPTVDEARGTVYVATGNNYTEPVTGLSDAVVALDLRTGRRKWARQLAPPGEAWNAGCNRPGKANCPDEEGPDHDFGSSPILVKDVLVCAQKSGMVYGLDLQGKVLWQTRVGEGGKLGGVQWGSATDGDLVFAAVSDVVWKVMGTRVMGGFVFDATKGGGLQALRVATGEKVWRAAAPVCGDRAACSPAQSAAVTAMAGAVFSGSMDGWLRAYSSVDGRVIWAYDTVREFKAVNGAAGKGGAIDSAGPVVAGGMVFTTSGYSLFGGAPGNVLLAFGLDSE